MSKIRTYHIATHVTDLGIIRHIESWCMCISHLRLDKRQRRRLKRAVKKAIRNNQCVLT